MAHCQPNNITDTEIAVTGIGGLCALGPNFPVCMENLFLGRLHIGQPTRFSTESAPSYPVFEIDDGQVSWNKHYDHCGRTAQLAVVAATEALGDAGYLVGNLAGKRVGVCIGTTVGNSMNNEEFYRQYRLDNEPDLFEMERYFRSNPAEVVAEALQLKGPVMTVANACSSGTDALGIGLSWLHADLCDIVLAGGSDELSHISYLGFISLMIHSDKTCRPFDRRRKGLNLGEGAAMLVLEKETMTSRRKCTVSAYASACDAYHLTAPHPDGRGLRQALTETMAYSGVKNKDIGFINAHGTGTLDNDMVEMKVFAEMFPQIPYFSIKGCTGHTLGAAGAIEAAISVGCLLGGQIPASVGFSELSEGLTNPPTTTPQAIEGKYAISQSLAFGGNNSVIMFER